MADLLLRLVGEDAVSGVFGNAGNAVKMLTTEAIAFGKESKAAADEQDKSNRRLQRSAGDLTDTYKAQAAAMQEQLGVSDDMVQTMQSMLLEFGQAPDEIEATTRALLDLSAATGRDALSTTKELLSATQSGKTAFKDLGLEYEKTGKAGKDLANITAALAGKFGGAAADESNSLEGQARKAAEAVGELKESVGGLINEFITKTGAIGIFTDAIKGLQEVLFNTTEEKYQAKANAMTVALGHQATALDNVKFAQQDLDAAMRGDSGAGPTQIEYLSDQLKAAKKYAEEAKDAIRALTGNTKTVLPGTGTADSRETGKGGRDEKAREEEIEKVRKYFEDVAEVEDGEAARVERKVLDFEEREAKASQDRDARLDREYLKKIARKEKEKDQEDKQVEEQIKRAEKAQKRIQDAADAQNKKFEETMAEAGAAIGVAFVRGLENALEQAMSGEEVDGVEVGLDILSTVLSIAGMAIGTYAGGAAGGAVGSAVGSLAGTGIKALYKHEKRPKKHEGGWLERYHDGGWPAGLGSDEQLIVGQTDERMLSRGEIQRMGGKNAVDAAASGRGRGGGGGGPPIQVVGALEFFEAAGGRGLYNAQRTGRGNVAGLLGAR